MMWCSTLKKNKSVKTDQVPEFKQFPPSFAALK